METNQLAPQTPPPRVAPSYLPIRVAYVHAADGDLRDPFIPTFRDFCHEQKIHFTTRVYAPYTFAEDCDYIERLPALQLYQHGHIQKTFYPNTRPYQIVQEVAEKYVLKTIAANESKGAWKRRIAGIRESIASLMRKKTRMEKVEEERLRRETASTIVQDTAPVVKKIASGKPKLLSSI